MRTKITRERKFLRTDSTLIWFLTSMNENMILKIGLFRESSCTNRTSEWPRSIVNMQMTTKIAWCRKTLRTLTTFMRFILDDDKEREREKCSLLTFDFWTYRRNLLCYELIYDNKDWMMQWNVCHIYHIYEVSHRNEFDDAYLMMKKSKRPSNKYHIHVAFHLETKRK